MCINSHPGAFSVVFSVNGKYISAKQKFIVPNWRFLCQIEYHFKGNNGHRSH